MRVSIAVTSSLLFLLVLSVTAAEDEQASGIGTPHHGVRIPEHTCQRRLEMKVCESTKCSQQCSKQTLWGVGKCMDTSYCSCSYYCRQPTVSPFTSPPTAEHIAGPPR